MHRFLQLLAAGVLLGSMVTGCSTPGRRARQRPEAFHRLSTSDQKLVLHGHVRPGLSADGVYIAWGEPDSKTQGVGTGKADVHEETWVYRQRVTLYNPMSFYEHFGPYHGYGDVPTGRRFQPGYAVGGIGDEGFLDYRPNVRSMDTLRLAVFSAGKVDRCKDSHGNWQQAPPATVAVAPIVAGPVSVAAKSVRATHHTPHAKAHGAKRLKKVLKKSAKATAHHHHPPHRSRAPQNYPHSGDSHHPAAKKHPRAPTGEHRR